MSGFPIDHAPPTPDHAAYNDYLGEGPAHIPPPKRMKCAEDDEKKKTEEVDPVSVDVFASSQESSNSGYATAPDEVEEEEEVVRKKKKVVEEEDEVVVDSQGSEEFGDSDGTLTIDNQMDLEATLKTAMPLTPKANGGAEQADDSNHTALALVDSIIEQDTQSQTPGKSTPRRDSTDQSLMQKTPRASISNGMKDGQELSSPPRDSHPHASPINTLETFSTPRGEISYLRTLLSSPPATGKKSEGPVEEKEVVVADSVAGLEHLQLGSSLEKRLVSSETRRKQKEQCSETPVRPMAAEQLQPTDGFDQSGPLHVEMLDDIPPSPDASTSDDEYSKYLDNHFAEWFGDGKLAFRPDFRGKRYNPRNHKIYCDIPGHKRDDTPRESGRMALMKQPWNPITRNGQRNVYYAERKAYLKNFLNCYRVGGYQLFIGLLETMYECEKIHEMPALMTYIHEESKRIGEDQVVQKFADVVAFALEAEHCIPAKVHRLVGSVESVTFSQHQCACILSWMFFINSAIGFKSIICGNEPLYVEKLKFLFAYFSAARRLKKGGTVSFRKQRTFGRGDAVVFYGFDQKINARVMSSDFKIENSALCTQVDFANKFIGGGVRERGFVQEEIRFLMCPEMMVSMYLCDEMDRHEAISIIGAQAYSSYTGYSHTTKWRELTERDSLQNDIKFRDHYGRLRVETIAIDALNLCRFSPRDAFQRQTESRSVDREFQKAYTGFLSQGDHFPLPIVTGWWGCGAFNGHKPLKTLIQACAAARANRELWICPFGDEQMAEKTRRMFQMIEELKVTAGSVMHCLLTMPPRRTQTEFFAYDYLAARLNKDFAPQRSAETTLPPMILDRSTTEAQESDQ